MVEALVNFVIWLVSTIFSDGLWTLMSIIAIIIANASIVTVVINRGKERQEKIENRIQIGGSILTIIIAVIILSITLR